jgi:hypothetical protein
MAFRQRKRSARQLDALEQMQDATVSPTQGTRAPVVVVVVVVVVAAAWTAALTGRKIKMASLV